MSDSEMIGDVDMATLVPQRSPIDDNLRWAGFTHRPGDVFVCTPPKCGTTWTQTIVTTLIFGGEPMPDPVLVLSPWLEMRFLPLDEVLSGLSQQRHRRCIKSHTPADGIPWWDDARYIVVGRDGRDAFMSFLNHMRSMRLDVMMQLVESAMAEGIELGAPPPIHDVHEFFTWWLDGATLFRFFATFWQRRAQPNVLFVHFNDLKADLDGQMRRIARFLDIAVDEDRWPAMVEFCTFESMKANADLIGPFDVMFEGGAESFLYKGTNDRWRDVLTAEELAAFDARANELLPADARAWLSGEHVPGVSD